MKNIGILTFHDTLNYGATLQCYALQKTIEEMGASVEIIDYKCPRFEKEYSPFYVSQKKVKKIAYMLCAIKMNCKKQKKKRVFHQKYLKLSQKYFKETIAESNKNYEMFIVGSDQVWNWKLTDFDKTYFLDFVDEGRRKISYAASFGLNDIDVEYQDIYRKLLQGYDKISVREKRGMVLLRQLGISDSELVSDPVLLLNRTCWEEIATVPKMNDYILLYTINNTDAYEYAKKLSQRTNKKLIYLSAPLKAPFYGKKIREIGPDEFVGWFLNAAYIVTDSFHGTVFSVLFQKQFVSFQKDKNRGVNSRIKSMLEILALEKRAVENKEEQDIICMPIDYEKTQILYDQYVIRSKDFLKKVIGEI